MPGHHLSVMERRLQDRWGSTFGPSLRSIEISDTATLRGISGVTLDLRYPLVVLAGKNGTGKSTFLACAACAYRNTGAFESFFFKKKYFNFNDLFVKSPLDPGFDNVSVKWTFRQPNGTIAMTTAIKKTIRWSGYQNRPNRPVEFLGLIRALHPTELRTLRNYFGSSATITPVSLGTSSKELVSCIMARNYDDVQCATEGKYSLHVLNSRGARYSGFNAGSGEDIACLISRVVESLPQNGLLIIEEIETGLHPAAQRQLIRKLLECCWEKRLQIVCSSHSQAILEAVPADSRVLLVRHGESLQPRYGVSVAEAMSDMVEIPVAELWVYVEDGVAKQLVLECLPADIRKRVRIVDCGNWDDVIRFVSVFHRDPKLGNAIGILDGDRNGKDAEHRSSFDKYMGGKAKPEEWAWLQERLHYLPGTVTPETLLCQYGQEIEYRNCVSIELNATVGTINDFFASFVKEEHNLFYELGQRVGLEKMRVLVGLAKAACVNKEAEFQALRDFINQRLEAE